MPFHRRRWLSVALSTTVLGLSVVSAMQHAGARTEPDQVPGGFRSWADLQRTQSRLNSAADTVEGAAAMVGSAGLTSVVAAPEKRELVLYWHGPMPEPVRQAIEDQRRTVPIRIEPARYSKATLLAESERLSTEARAARLPLGSIAPLPDGSGLRVTAGSGRLASVSAHPVLARSAVHVEVGGGSGVATPIDRYDDSAPYYGGARTLRTVPGGTGRCTAGFAIWLNNDSRMLTAGHCGTNGQAIRDGGGDAMGTFQGQHATRDTGYIDTASYGQIWWGDHRATESRPVDGATPSRIGNWVCTSGAFSGTRCGIQVRAVNQRVEVVGGGEYFPMVMAEHANRENAAGSGDSGGPVFELGAGTSVIVKGTLSAVDFTDAPAPCTGETGDHRKCSWQVHYADAVDSLTHYNARLYTGDGPWAKPASLSGDPTAELVGVNNAGDGYLRGWYNDGSAFGQFPWIGPNLIGDSSHGQFAGAPAKVKFADLDGDRRKDLVVVNAFGDGFTKAWRNVTGWNNHAYPWTGEQPINLWHGVTDPNVMHFGDINGDGRDDMIHVNASGDRRVVVRPNNGRAFTRDHNGTPLATWEPPVEIGSGWTSGALVRFADLDSDGFDELIGVNTAGNGQIRAWPNNRTAWRPYPWGADRVVGYGWTDATKVRFADIDGDGYDDLVGVHSRGDGVILAWPNNHMFGVSWPWQEPSVAIGSGWWNAAVVQFA